MTIKLNPPTAYGEIKPLVGHEGKAIRCTLVENKEPKKETDNE